MKFSIEKDGSTIILDTDIIADLPEITHEEFMAKTDWTKDSSLLDHHILIGIGSEIKQSDMEKILENRGGYKTGNMSLVFWSEDIEDEKQAICLHENNWMIIFCWDKELKVELPKYIYNKTAYLK